MIRFRTVPCKTNSAAARKKFLHVDHDHACCPGPKSCGKCVRFLLCDKCNVGLGSFSDDPLRMAKAIIALKPDSATINEIIKRLEWFRDVRDYALAAK
jgi:hypothetical protein